MIRILTFLRTVIYTFLLNKLFLSKKFTSRGKIYFIYPSFILNNKKENVIIDDRAIINGFLITEGEGLIFIGKNTSVGKSTVIRSRQSVKIGSNCLLSSGVYIIDNNSHSVNYLDRREDIKNNFLYTRKFGSYLTKNTSCKAITIGDDVWIGRNATILKGVTIGNRVVIAAESVVTKDVPDDTVVAGNPAEIVKKIING